MAAIINLSKNHGCKIMPSLHIDSEWGSVTPFRVNDGKLLDLGDLKTHCHSLFMELSRSWFFPIQTCSISKHWENTSTSLGQTFIMVYNQCISKLIWRLVEVLGRNVHARKVAEHLIVIHF